MAESATPIVEIKGVSKVFRLQDQTIHALLDANLVDKQGRVRLPDRRVRLRQVDAAAHHGRLRAALVRRAR
jgi:hypothetical protein